MSGEKKKNTTLINLTPASANGWVVAFAAAAYCGKHSSKSVGEIRFLVLLKRSKRESQVHIYTLEKSSESFITVRQLFVVMTEH